MNLKPFPNYYLNPLRLYRLQGIVFFSPDAHRTDNECSSLVHFLQIINGLFS